MCAWEAGALEPAEIERRATTVLERVPDYIWDGESVPVPVEDIADTCFSLLVRDAEDLTEAPGCPPLEPGQALSGLLLAGRGEIWVNAEEARRWPTRRRFTIGHELGHWVLHRSGQQALFCRHATVAPEETAPAGKESGRAPADTRPPLPVTEEEANQFSAALLMPARLIRAHYRDCGGDFEELRRRFDISAAAMGKRLQQAVPRSGG